MIRKDDILKMTEKGISVFRYYLPVDFKVGKNFLNPFYKDTKASCNIYYERKAGVFKMKDFGNEDYSGDCFELVGRLNGLSCKEPKEFVEIMEMINRDLHLGLSTHEEYHVSHSKVPQKSEVVSEEPKAKSVRPYTVVQKPFTAAELAFWSKSGIGENVLKAYRTVSLKKFSSENQERKPFSCMTSVDEPMFGYMGKQHIKVYRPCSQMRFLYAGDFGDNYCFGLEQLPAKGDLLFITGGEKDVMSLAAHGFHAICFNSETAFIPAAVIHRLSFRFKHIILLYDVDSTGLKSSAKREEELKEYGVKRLLLPLAGTKTEKDVSDYFMLGNSREDLIKLFLDYLETLYSETMSALKSCEVDFNNPPPIAQMIVSVNDVPLGTQGNLLCITGGEGTGKSNYVAALIAGAIRPTGTDVDALGVTLHENGRNKAVLFYDTEQSEVQLYKNISNLLRRNGHDIVLLALDGDLLVGIDREDHVVGSLAPVGHAEYGRTGRTLDDDTVVVSDPIAVVGVVGGLCDGLAVGTLHVVGFGQVGREQLRRIGEDVERLPLQGQGRRYGRFGVFRLDGEVRILQAAAVCNGDLHRVGRSFGQVLHIVYRDGNHYGVLAVLEFGRFRNVEERCSVFRNCGREFHREVALCILAVDGHLDRLITRCRGIELLRNGILDEVGRVGGFGRGVELCGDLVLVASDRRQRQARCQKCSDDIFHGFCACIVW